MIDNHSFLLNFPEIVSRYSVFLFYQGNYYQAEMVKKYRDKIEQNVFCKDQNKNKDSTIKLVQCIMRFIIQYDDKDDVVKESV